MALNGNLMWEVRTAGSQNNGSGFWNRVPGTSVDYSQQSAAQLVSVDLAAAQGSSILTSTAGGFTAAMQGNIIHIISGTNFVPGWYEIVAYTNGNTITLDRPPATGGAGSNGTGYTGGAFAFGGNLDNDFFAANQKASGNIIHMKSGTHNLGESILISLSATSALPYKIIGYNVTRGDNPTGANRPLINGGDSYTFNINGNYWSIRNIRFTTNLAGTCFLASGNCFWQNCKFTSTNTTASSAFTANGGNSFISCEFNVVGQVTGSTCLHINTSYVWVINCYIHGGNIGINVVAGSGRNIIGCIIAGCKYGTAPKGISLSSYNYNSIFGCTIYDCTTGIFGTTSPLNLFFNNIISDCGTGASWTTQQNFDIWDYNCWHNTTDVSNVVKGPHDITADPLLKDPGNGDFTLDIGSPCFDAGIQLGPIVGLP